MGAAYLWEDLKKAAFGGQFSIFASNFMLSCMYLATNIPLIFLL